MILVLGTIMGVSNGEESKFNLFVIYFIGIFYTLDLLWAFDILTKIGRLHRAGGAEEFMVVN